MANLFSNDPTEAPALEELVGEGKKYSDINALVSAMVEKDRFIDQLQGENEELRVDLRARTSVEELLDKLPKQPSSSVELREPHDPGSETPSVEDIKSQILTELEEEQKKIGRTQNIEKAKEGLIERFGNEYKTRLQAVAKELGVTPQYLDDIAAASPSGLLKLVDSIAGTPPPAKPGVPPATSYDLLKNHQHTPKKTRSFFRELRKTDPNTYYSPKVQNEMNKLAIELGPAFFD